MTQRFEGHTLEEALAAATEAYGVQRHQITHRVLVEKRGFLGGIKRVVIEADVNEDAPPPAEPVEPAAPVPEYSPAPPAPPRESRAPREPRDSRGRGGARGGRGGGGRGRGNSDRDSRGGSGRGRRDRRDNDMQPGDFSRFAVEAPEQEEESQGASMVHAWCEQVLSLAKLSVVVRTTEDAERIHVRLYGPDGPRFTDKGGELLDAMQVLANKALTGRKVDKDIELDCEEFKQRRVTELGERARELADRVRSDGREQLLPAMTPIERRIVHLALQEDADVTTESRGEGFYKRVAVIKRSQTEPVEETAEATNDEP
ncbi:MAG TPA: R3H domain-containing nucleic acid-binding protein [Thermoanaerobaculia bacterium]|jgi:spoIIIJ-associated protein|nr:R3H domain-containing nucleic acid-binding protein [Thermoanaerobaculia bacterium]